MAVQSTAPAPGPSPNHQELDGAPDADNPKPGSKQLTACLEVRMAFRQHDVPVDRGLEVRDRYRIVGVLARVVKVEEAYVGEPEPFDDLDDLGALVVSRWISPPSRFTAAHQ